MQKLVLLLLLLSGCAYPIQRRTAHNYFELGIACVERGDWYHARKAFGRAWFNAEQGRAEVRYRAICAYEYGPQSTFDTHEVLVNAAREVHGVTGHTSQFLGRGEGDEDEDEIRITEVGWVRGSSGYLLTMNSKAPVHETWQPELETLVASFRFLDE